MQMQASTGVCTHYICSDGSADFLNIGHITKNMSLRAAVLIIHDPLEFPVQVCDVLQIECGIDLLNFVLCSAWFSVLHSPFVSNHLELVLNVLSYLHHAAVCPQAITSAIASLMMAVHIFYVFLLRASPWISVMYCSLELIDRNE